MSLLKLSKEFIGWNPCQKMMITPMKTKMRFVILVISARKLEKEQATHRNMGERRPENVRVHQSQTVNHSTRQRRFRKNGFD